MGFFSAQAFGGLALLQGREGNDVIAVVSEVHDLVLVLASTSLLF